jgi:large subunit ribosomal protein L33
VVSSQLPGDAGEWLWPLATVKSTAGAAEVVVMAKSNKREYVWLQCTECGDLNYRLSVNVQGGTPKLELKKYCPRTRNRQNHKIKRK